MRARRLMVNAHGGMHVRHASTGKPVAIVRRLSACQRAHVSAKTAEKKDGARQLRDEVRKRSKASGRRALTRAVSWDLGADTCKPHPRRLRRDLNVARVRVRASMPAYTRMRQHEPWYIHVCVRDQSSARPWRPVVCLAPDAHHASAAECCERSRGHPGFATQQKHSWAQNSSKLACSLATQAALATGGRLGFQGLVQRHQKSLDQTR